MDTPSRSIRDVHQPDNSFSDFLLFYTKKTVGKSDNQRRTEAAFDRESKFLIIELDDTVISVTFLFLRENRFSMASSQFDFAFAETVRNTWFNVRQR